MRFFKNKKIEIDEINLSTKIKIELIKIMSDLIDLNDETTNVFSVTPQVAGKKRKRHFNYKSRRKRIGHRVKRSSRSSSTIIPASSSETLPPPPSNAQQQVIIQIPISNLPSSSPYSSSSNQKKKITFKDQEEICITIKQLYKLNFIETYSADQLCGRGGIINTIQGMLNNKVAYHTIKTVILEVNKAEDEGCEYDATRKV